MRRIWLLSLLAVPLIAGATASVPAPAQAQDVFGLMRAPMRLMHNLGLRGRLFHRRARTHHAAVTPGPDPRATASAAAATPQTQTDRRTGPGYWPEGFDDLFGFVFAPGTGDRFWQHGSLDILTAALAPAAGGGRVTLARAEDGKSASACETSNERDGGAVYQAIETNVQPTPEQQDAFKALREAMATAQQRIDAACAAGFMSARPNERLNLLADRLAAMRQATLVVRTPLEAAYNTLSDEQKARLDGSNAATVSCQTDLMAAGAWPGNDIMRAVRPSEAQRPVMERFRGTFLGMSQQLSKSCPQQQLGNVMTRLDAAGERLNAVLYATRIVNRSLNAVYAKLDDGQRARLQAAGRQVVRFNPARAAELNAPR